MSKHYEFINEPIEDILKELVNVTSNLDKSINTYPLNDYLLKSTFLKMTGFQEQKFKCIAWELATEDFEFRRRFLSSMSNEYFSTYDSKNDLYKALKNKLSIDSLSEKDKKSDSLSEKDKKSIVDASKNVIVKLFRDTCIEKWNQRDFIEFKQNIKKTAGFSQIDKGGNLFESTAQNLYKNLYNNRNRMAHNTISYQYNIPTLFDLEKNEFGSNNYFVWFYILILIDKIMISLFKKFYEERMDLLWSVENI